MSTACQKGSPGIGTVKTEVATSHTCFMTEVQLRRNSSHPTMLHAENPRSLGIARVGKSFKASTVSVAARHIINPGCNWNQMRCIIHRVCRSHASLSWPQVKYEPLVYKAEDQKYLVVRVNVTSNGEMVHDIDEHEGRYAGYYQVVTGTNQI